MQLSISKWVFLSIGSLLIPFVLYAQETVVKGKITDAETNDGLPFVNIYFKGTIVGSSSNFEGYYEIRTMAQVDSLHVSCLGYNSKLKPVKNGVEQIINFQLAPSVHTLSEIVIVPGENPAFKVLRKMEEFKTINNPDQLTAYQFENYNRIQIGVDNMSERFKNRKIFKPVSNMFDSLQVIAGEEGQAVLPIFISETFSDYFFREDPRRTKENIIASRISGIGVDDHNWINQMMGSSFQVFNFYQNWVTIFGKNFISPLAKTGKMYYRYYLVDSVKIGKRKCYELVIEPKHEKDLAFWGTIWLEDSTYALKQLDLEIKKEANLNWIEKVKIQQEFQKTAEGPWLASKTRTLIDFVEIGKQPGFISKSYTSSKSVIVNQPKALEFYEGGIEVSEEAFLKDMSYWETHRHDTLTSTEKDVFNMIDSVKNLPTVRTLVDVVELAVYGYQPIGKIDLGPYIFLYKYNEIEGHRFRLGFTTNETFSTNLILKGYLAYGTNDFRYKYNTQAEYILSRKPWTKIGFQHRDDIDQISITDDFFSKNNLFKFTAGFSSFDRLNNSFEYRIWAERMLFPGFNQTLMFHNRHFTPYFDFGYYPDPNDSSNIKSNFRTSELSAEARFSARERYVYTHLDRISIGSSNKPPPVFSLKYALGIKGLFSSDFVYHKLMFNVSQTLKLGTLGKSEYSITAGKVFNTLPYPLLQVHKGNETVVSDPDAFYLMNFFEFVSDQWVSLFYEHHFEGLLTNRVPLLKKLKLRTLVMSNWVYGSLKPENNVQISNMGEPLTLTVGGETIRESFSNLSEKPYVEVGWGIENILNFIRLDAVYRLTYINEDYLAIYPRNVNPFGLKLSFQFRL